MSNALDRLKHKTTRLLENLTDPIRQYEFKEWESRACKKHGRKQIASLLNAIGKDKADSLFDILHNRPPRHA